MKDGINRLQSAVTALVDDGADPVLIMETLAAISGNLARRVPHIPRLAAVIAAAQKLSLQELYRLDTWLYARIADVKAQAAGDIPPSPSRIVVEERQGKDISYRLEFVKCGKASCVKCRRGPAHGPYWYAFGQGAGRGWQKYIGKTLDPEALAASISTG